VLLWHETIGVIRAILPQTSVNPEPIHSPLPMTKTYRIVVLLMAVWLVACIVFSWASILDDALIHLRYADNLLRTHHLTYDGIHPNYGVSSLLYVSLLAFLSSVIASPNLPRGVSSVFHLLLFSGMAVLLARSIPRQLSRVRLLGLILLLLLIVPSAIRWLDDGMETGLVLCFTSLICWLTFRESQRAATSVQTYAGLFVLGFFTVLLRTELAMLCAIVFAILTLKRAASHSQPKSLRTWFNAALSSSHLLVGNLLAMALIVLRMHVLLADTAVAKSHGDASIYGTLEPAAHAIVGGFSFGVGMLLLWLLTFFLLLRARKISLPLLFANAPFPLILFLAGLRGQEMQGIRYLVWTLLFSALWNILELGAAAPDNPPIEQDVAARVLTYALLALILIAQPLEFSLVYPILHDRAKLMAMIPGKHLDVLQGKLGVAADVGIIGYFTKANICDLDGLINGREFARLTPQQRNTACAAQKPDFVYLDRSELGTFSGFMPLGNWQVCGEYEMTGFRYKDIHYLIVPPSTADHICRETSFSRPYSVNQLFTQPDSGTGPRLFF
jgi:hypothetical protein